MLHAAYRNYLDVVAYLAEIGVSANMIDSVNLVLVAMIT